MNKAVLIAVPAALVVGGGVVGAAMAGLIEIPGLTPEKQKQKSTALYTEDKEETKPSVKKQNTKEREPQKKESIPADLVKGRKELAKLWNEIESKDLVLIVAKWPDEELAHQLRYLDVDKTAEVLALMKAERAAKLSKTLQSLGSIEPPVKKD